MGYEVQLEHPGEISWFKSYPEEEHRRPVGPCPHTECQHLGTSVVAWGPDLDHYELWVCDDNSPGGCDGWCRGWKAVDDNAHGGTHGPKRQQEPAYLLMDSPSSLKVRQAARAASR